MPMQWTDLLSPLRCPKSPSDAPKTPEREATRSPFEADYDRIVFSTPFRRLARKTQVHPMAMNDQVHNRLTHSVEVASVGRSFGRRIAHFLTERNEFPKGFQENDFVWIIQAACLAHDLGNPPFGHAGEYAIREWVKTHPAEVFGAKPADVSAEIQSDLMIFEGNAQGFRIAARADNPQAGYLRLTFATLGAMIKYPWDVTDPRAARLGKFNVFFSEKPLFDLMARHTGMLRPDNSVARHPLSFLSEAADDICYRILDLEDAVEMRILAEDRVRGIYRSLLDPADPSDGPLAILRGKAIGSLIEGAWQVFVGDYPRIMRGERTEDLRASLAPHHAAALDEIKQLYAQIFADRTKVAAELGAYKTLGRILKALCQATQKLSATHSWQDAGFLAQRCLELAWGKAYVEANKDQQYSWWLHQSLDYVAALTDNYARQLSREIEGT